MKTGSINGQQVTIVNPSPAGFSLIRNPLTSPSTLGAGDREFKSLYPDNENNILVSSETPCQTMRLFCFHT